MSIRLQKLATECPERTANSRSGLPPSAIREAFVLPGFLEWCLKSGCAIGRFREGGTFVEEPDLE